MFFRSLIILSTLSLLSTPVPADVYGPTLGILADLPDNAIRPIRGIPGAATIGDPIDLGGSVTGISLAPRQSNALLTTASGLQTASLQPDSTLVIADAGLPGGFAPALIAFSPAGSIAALYDASANALWLRSNRTQRLDISKLPGSIDLLAASDAPNHAVAGALSGRQSVFIVDNQGAYRLISGFAEVTDLTFIGSTGDLAIADRGQNQLLLVRDPFSGSAPQLLFNMPDVAGAPITVASSADGALLAVLAIAKQGRAALNGVVASPGPQEKSLRPIDRHASPHPRATLGLLRMADRQWSPVECGCTPVTLAPLAGNAVFRLTQSIAQPLWILDADSGAPRVVFIPAVAK